MAIVTDRVSRMAGQVAGACAGGRARLWAAVAARAGMTQPALSRLEAGGVVPTIPLFERISAALHADLIVEIAPHAA